MSQFSRSFKLRVFPEFIVPTRSDKEVKMQVNQTAKLLPVESSENLQVMTKAMGKLLIVSLVWSGTDLLNKNVPTAVQPRAEPAQ